MRPLSLVGREPSRLHDTVAKSSPHTEHQFRHPPSARACAAVSGGGSSEARMVGVYSIKPHLQAAIRPIVTSLARAGVRPNAVTIAACVGSFAVGAVVGYE